MATGSFGLVLWLSTQRIYIQDPNVLPQPHLTTTIVILLTIEEEKIGKDKRTLKIQ